MALTPSERALRSRLASYTSWARTEDPSTRTAPARAASRTALDTRFEREVDPEGTLPPAERARRAEHARKSYFAGLALKSARSRRKARESREAAARYDQDAALAESKLDSGGPGDAA